MIHWSNLFRALGFFILGLDVGLLLSLGVAIGFQDRGIWPLAFGSVIATLVGLALIWNRPRLAEFNNRDGILLVILTWGSAGLLGALPYAFSEAFPSFTDAIFESISGFTTTGSTILADIESVPESLLFWRSLTQWVGGMGIVLLGVAILPLIGVGGKELYRAEFSGAFSEKLKPRIAQTALALWKVYLAFTVAAFVGLLLAGMNSFDAICHAFTTMATGGFSTRNASIESFANPLIEYLIIFFMFVAGINFTQHYRLLVQRRPRAFSRDPEIRAYAAIVLIAILAIVFNISTTGGTTQEESFRSGMFQVVSILTTTGFSSVDFELWPVFSQLLLLALMFVGGCTGSTAGGLKISRIVLLFGTVGRQFRQVVERRGVFAVRFGDRAISEEALRSLLNLVYFSVLINFGACLFLTAFDIDLLTAISAVASAMFNIGPGLGQVGPTENFAFMAAPVKWVLALCMLAGRLEFYTVFVIFAPSFWKK